MLNGEVASKADALHAIMRLKAGLSPGSCLEALTVDFSAHEAFIQGFIRNRGSNLAVVVGPYGSGKTHFLQLAKRLASKAGYLVTSLGQETGLGILSFPHRHVSVMLSNLRGEKPIGRLIDHAVYQIDSNPKEYLETATAIAPSSEQTNRFLSQLEFLLQLGPEAGRASRVLEFLSGLSLAGQAGTVRDRIRAYDLLRFWIAYARELFNIRGLVIVVDELESLFSTAVYSSIRSRKTAYRSLSYYTSMGLDVRILLALTPDGWYGLQNDVHTNPQYIADQASLVLGEDLPSLVRVLRTVRPHELRRFSEDEYLDLMKRIMFLHSEAREYSVPDDAKIPFPSGMGITPRVFSRSVVSALEAIWFKNFLNGTSVNLDS
jgi:hypothetical protein